METRKYKVRVELHLTYRCDLACWYCNRGCRLKTDHTPDLAVEQFERFLEDPERPELERVVLIGGEPTLHPEIMRFAELCKGQCEDVRIYSNAHRPKAREVLAKLERRFGIKNSGGTEKPGGDVKHLSAGLYLAPADAGERRGPCSWAASLRTAKVLAHGQCGDETSPPRGACGYSVDAMGITACAIGGAVDGILGLGVRTWSWAQVLGEPERLRRLCQFCGANREPAAVKKEWVYRGQRVSGTWAERLNAKGSDWLCSC